jgi:hypothetical protein
VSEAGLVHQLATNGAGPSTSGSKTFDQSSPGVKGDPVDYDQFGFSLS